MPCGQSFQGKGCVAVRFYQARRQREELPEHHVQNAREADALRKDPAKHVMMGARFRSDGMKSEGKTWHHSRQAPLVIGTHDPEDNRLSVARLYEKRKSNEVKAKRKVL